ncbi:NUDIX hydrolase [candidate division WWE3 bacterium]|nr:NUDIX hydrolase [candidate division WWE3 bacterium]
MPLVEASPRWPNFATTEYFVSGGFPFQEGWPIGYPREEEFIIRLRDGSFHRARVDFTTQYRDEGLRWRTSRGQLVDKSIVVCWHRASTVGPRATSCFDGRHPIRHHSVGAMIEADGAFLLINRRKGTPGYAGIAGHQEYGETPDEALIREIGEESGLQICHAELVIQEDVEETCRRGIPRHLWSVYWCRVQGAPQLNQDEARAIGWYMPTEIVAMPLEPVWRTWFERMQIINTVKL